jgi:PHD/YefM family antitoxin component YafN of YafNO toxin-antitoxin module
MTLHPKYITDETGSKSAVILPIKEYDMLLEELEEIEDIRIYDEAKKGDDGFRINLDDYIKQRKAKNG